MVFYEPKFLFFIYFTDSYDRLVRVGRVFHAHMGVFTNQSPRTPYLSPTREKPSQPSRARRNTLKNRNKAPVRVWFQLSRTRPNPPGQQG